MTDHKATLRHAYDAVNDGNVDGFIAISHPDILWVEARGHVVRDSPFTGIKDVQERFFPQVFQMFAPLELRVNDIVVDGDTAVVLGTYRGRGAPGGQAFEAEFVHTWTFEDGKVVRLDQLADTAILHQAVHGRLDLPALPEVPGIPPGPTQTTSTPE